MNKQNLILIAILFLVIGIGCATTKSDWEKAQRLNTIEAYQEFLRKYPNSEFTSDAKKKMEILEWEKAKQDDTIKAYQEFLRKYPNSEFTSDAKKKIEILEWEKAKQDDTIEAYQEFLKKYPNSEFTSDAKKKMEILEWKKAKQNNTVKAYKKYLSKYPNGSFAKKAKKYLEVLRILKTLKSSFQLEKLLERYPEAGDLIVPELEHRIMNEIKNKGVKNRFVIKEITIDKTNTPYSITVKNEKKVIDLVAEFPGDGQGVIIYRGYLSLISGTIHRFVGKIPLLIEGYTFIGEGDKLHRLTFGVIENVGYVYLRGKGRVILKNGKEIKLGY